MDLTGGIGVDFAFEAIGFKVAAEQAYESIRSGGTATIIGMIPVGENIEIPGLSILGEKKLQGSLMGSNRFKVDMPKYIDFYRQGRLKLEEMVTKRGRLEDVNDAFQSIRAREVARREARVARFPALHIGPIRQKVGYRLGWFGEIIV